jgi:hypothetical protein
VTRIATRLDDRSPDITFFDGRQQVEVWAPGLRELGSLASGEKRVESLARSLL